MIKGVHTMFYSSKPEALRTFLREKLRYADNIFVVCEFSRAFIHEHYPDLRDRIDGGRSHSPLGIGQKLLQELKTGRVAELTQTVDRLLTHAHHVVGLGNAGKNPDRGGATALGELGDRRPAYPGVAVS